MSLGQKQNIEVVLTPLEVVWRNPRAIVQAHLRLREASDPYYGWAEQGRRIRARRTNWKMKHDWVA
jgi:hypothetical protein